jgi:Ulp1 family protease
MTPGVFDAEHFSQTLPKKNRINFFQFDYLFIPANIVHNHWYFMVVIFNHTNNIGTILPLDSIKKGKDGYKNDHQTILRFLNAVRESSILFQLLLV